MKTGKETKNKEDNVTVNVTALFEEISSLIEKSRKSVATAINTAEVYSKFYIGKYIVDFEQKGERRAQYGQQILKELSDKLTDRFGNGWSVETLTFCRKFFIVYSRPNNNENRATDEFRTHCVRNSNGINELLGSEEFNSSNTPTLTLSWSHYRILMRVGNPDARSFYEIECARQQWSVRELNRQVGSSMYERLALSRDKDEVMRLATEGQTIEKPSDIIKDPITLEFLGLKPDVAYTETKLENANIYASQYSLYLPDKNLLQQKLKEWIDEFSE